MSTVPAAAPSRETYNARFAHMPNGRSLAIQFEQECLSVGREFLPVFAHAVLAGDEPSPRYWAWLLSTLDVVEREATEHALGWVTFLLGEVS